VVRSSAASDVYKRQSNTNRNTILSFYKVEDGNHRRELPINNNGYVYTTTGVDYDDNANLTSDDYPVTLLPRGEYIFLITNDIRYLETTYSFTLTSFNVDWRYVTEAVEEAIDFRLITEGFSASIDFGSIVG
jgi:hypothetical protein